MDKKTVSPTVLLAPGASASGALWLPSAQTFPPLDERLVEPETREEIVRGRRVLAMPSNPPHGDRHCELDYVVRAHIRPDYVGSTDLLTRSQTRSDFATDTCIRKSGIDPATGTRYLEEIAFEIVNEQPLKELSERAEDLSGRGVRRIFAIFVKKGEVCEWSVQASAFQRLSMNDTIRDPCLSRPIVVNALLDAAAADNAVALALLSKQNPVLTAREAQIKREAILAVLAARNLVVSEEVRARIRACTDSSTLDRWIAKAAVARSAAEVGVEP